MFKRRHVQHMTLTAHDWVEYPVACVNVHHVDEKRAAIGAIRSTRPPAVRRNHLGKELDDALWRNAPTIGPSVWIAIVHRRHAVADEQRDARRRAQLRLGLSSREYIGKLVAKTARD